MRQYISSVRMSKDVEVLDVEVNRQSSSKHMQEAQAVYLSLLSPPPRP